MDARAIQRARKKLQAEFDILNDASLDVQARKNELIQWLDNLKPEQLAWHLLIYRNTPLLDFLERGVLTAGDWTAHTPAFHTDAAFYEFVIAQVTERYDALFAEAFRVYDVQGLKQLKQFVLPNAAKRGRYYYSSTINLLTAHYHNLLQLSKDLVENAYTGTLPAYTEIPFLLALNELPPYFQSMRNEFAQSLAQLAYMLKGKKRAADAPLADAALFVATSLSVSAPAASKLAELKKEHSGTTDELKKSSAQATSGSSTGKNIGGCLALIILLGFVIRILRLLIS